jgi:hypothetical protein
MVNIQIRKGMVDGEIKSRGKRDGLISVNPPTCKWTCSLETKTRHRAYVDRHVNQELIF